MYRSSRRFLKKCITLLCLVFTTSIAAQHNFEPGYIVKEGNDTIFGFVEEGNEKVNALNCYFKTTSDAKVVKYGPQELKSYGITYFRHYNSKLIEYNGYTKPIFLQYLLDGVIDLYYFIDEHSKTHYFVEKDTLLVEINNDEVKRFVNGHIYTTNTFQYIHVLKALTAESPKVQAQIENTSFKAHALVNTLKDYHYSICDTIHCIVYSRKPRKLNDVQWQVRLGVIAAYSLKESDFTYHLNYTGSIYTGLFMSRHNRAEVVSSNFAKTFYNNNYTLKGQYFYPGIYVNITKMWRTFLQVEFHMRKSEVSNNFISITSTDLDFPILLKREFWQYNKLSPFVTLGISLGSRTYKPQQLDLTYSFPDSESTRGTNSTSVDFNYASGRILQSGPLFGAGLRYELSQHHSVNFEFRIAGTVVSTEHMQLDGLTQLNTTASEANYMFKIDYCYIL